MELSIPADSELNLSSVGGPCALEDDNFPFEQISDIAELESWRKEINRPIYHIHKWWAQRLGSVFRAITIGALTPTGTNIMNAFYRPIRLAGSVVFDPFMGSGTTIGEAAKLGARVIGCDINVVAHFLVRNALSFHDRSKILNEFASIEQDVAVDIRSYYRTHLSDGEAAEVLYFFWVKTAPCPCCHHEVGLFSSRIFARHAYPKRYQRRGRFALTVAISTWCVTMTGRCDARPARHISTRSLARPTAKRQIARRAIMYFR